jgi:sugar lactone lactonase YvrE
MERDARQRAEALDQFWDDLLAEGAAERPPGVDEVYATTMRRVNALGATPGLAAARERVWQTLVQRRTKPTEQSVTRDTAPYPVTLPPSGLNGRAAPHPGPDQPRPPGVIPRSQRWAPAYWAMAALLVLTAVGGLVVLAQGLLRPEAIVMTAPQLMGRFDQLWRTTGEAEPLVAPQGLAVDAAGNVWVVDAGSDRIEIFAPDGSFLETWGASGSEEGQFEFAVRTDSDWAGFRGDIAFDAAGNLYVVDTGNHRIQKFAPDRSFLLAWGEEGDGDGQFLTALSIAIGPDDSVYVSDADRRDVQKFDANGRFLGITGEYELDNGKPSAAAGVAVDGQGFIWVADQANHRIARFSPDGTFLDAWGVRGTRPGELLNPRDLAIDAAGLVYVIDSNVHRVQLFAPDGRFLAETRSDLTRPDSFTAPQAIALGRDGTVFISDDFSVHALRVVERIGDALMP